MKDYKVNYIPSFKNVETPWSAAEKLEDFTLPWEDKVAPNMSFRALWDDNKFYFRFEVKCSEVLTYVDTNHKMEVVNSDRVEIFFKKDENLNPYYCLEMDAHSRVLDYQTNYYRKFDYEWSWPKQGELDVKANVIVGGYSVEGSINLSSLKEMGILNEDTIFAGLYRGWCTELKKPDSELSWISWVHPDSKDPDFHIPSSFGKLMLVK